MNDRARVTRRTDSTAPARPTPLRDMVPVAFGETPRFALSSAGQSCEQEGAPGAQRPADGAPCGALPPSVLPGSLGCAPRTPLATVSPAA